MTPFSPWARDDSTMASSFHSMVHSLTLRGRGGNRAVSRPLSRPIPWESPGRFPCNARYSRDRKSTRLNSSHQIISYAVFCLKKKKKTTKFRAILIEVYLLH